MEGYGFNTFLWTGELLLPVDRTTENSGWKHIDVDSLCSGAVRPVRHMCRGGELAGDGLWEGDRHLRGPAPSPGSSGKLPGDMQPNQNNA